MKRFFNYFSLNQTEERGFVFLLLLILLVLFVPSCIKSCDSDNVIHYHLVKLEHETIEENSKTNLSGVNKFDRNNTFKVGKSIDYFSFDPNLIDESSWSKLGLTEKQIKVIMNYRSKGGKFYKKEDLAKIYSLSSIDYERLEPYITIESSNKEGSFVSKILKEEIKSNKSLLVDINESDTSLWQKLNGIGPVLSKRIVKYRDALGGFHSIEQLKEVYGLPMETYNNIKSNLRVNPSFRVYRININTCSEDELNRHPYFNKKLVKTILNYRNNHGNFDKLESLSQIKSLDSIFLRKIGNYLEY